MAIDSYRDLIVWQRAMELVDATYVLSKALPHEEVFVLRSQLLRSAISVPSNIAEGRGRGTGAEFARFLDISKGSLIELETLVEIGIRQNYWDRASCARVVGLADECGRMLETLRRKLRADRPAPDTIREELASYDASPQWLDPL